MTMKQYKTEPMLLCTV